MIEEQGSINLNTYNSKIYAYVIRCDSKVTFFDEGKDAAFRPFFYFLCTHLCIIDDMLYKGNGKKNTYVWMRKYILINWFHQRISTLSY